MNNKKEQFWAAMLLTKLPPAFTKKRLEKIKPIIFQDDDFWSDILFRHNGNNFSPEEMKANNQEIFEHCISNMIGMVMQTMVENKIIKP